LHGCGHCCVSGRLRGPGMKNFIQAQASLGEIHLVYERTDEGRLEKYTSIVDRR
jgi:hypothetical protein